MKPLTAEEIAELRASVKYAEFGPNLGSRVPDALPRLLNEVERSRALLKRLAWSGRSSGDYAICPVCGGYQGQHHEPDCELAALLGAST